MVSTFVSTTAVIADFGLAVLLIGGVAYAARADRNPAVLWVGAAAIVGWFAAAFLLSHHGAYETTATTTMPPAIAPAIALPIILGCALLALAPARRAIGRVPLQWLVGVQTYRIVGGIFLIGYLQGDIPGQFALPAGIGDVLVGLLAPFVATRLAVHGVERAWPVALAWCALGLGDLFVAVTCGFLSAPSTIQQLALDHPNTAITSYPLVLIPVFAVPASIVLHVFAISRLRTYWQAAPRPLVA
jgi:hypothetical protein